MSVGEQQLPRQLGAECVGYVLPDPVANAGFRAWFASLAPTTAPTTQQVFPDDSPAPMAVYVYVNGPDEIFVGADLIQNPSYDPNSPLNE